MKKKSKNSDAFKIQKRLMTLTGFWPYRTSSVFYKIYGTLHYTFVVGFAFSLLMSTMVLSDFSKLIQSWSMFVAILNCSVKFTMFYFKMEPFMDMVDFLKLSHFSYYDAAYDRHLSKSVKFTQFMTKFFFCSGTTTVLCILSAPLLNNQEPRQTPLPFPLDLTKYHVVVYLLVYLYQIVALSSAAWISIGFDNLSTSMMGISAAYFRILRDTILEILNSEAAKNELKSKSLYDNYQAKEKDIFEKLGSCVSHHIALLEFTEAIENIFTYVFLSQFLSSAAGICLVGFTFMNAPPGSMEFIFALSFLGTLMFQITLYCTYGNAVTVDSYKIGDACYMSEWIYTGSLVRQALFLIMERSKRPLKLTAGKFVELSLTSLMAVLKSAVSYAAVLRQLTEKNAVS